MSETDRLPAAFRSARLPNYKRTAPRAEAGLLTDTTATLEEAVRDDRGRWR